MPLIRMVISGIGDWKSRRCEEAFELFQTFIRTTLRKMTGAPKNASSEVFDYLSGWNQSKFIRLIEELDEANSKATQVIFEDQELMFCPSDEWLTVTEPIFRS